MCNTGCVQDSQFPIPGAPGGFQSKFQEFFSQIPGAFMSIQYAYIACISTNINKSTLIFLPRNTLHAQISPMYFNFIEYLNKDLSYKQYMNKIIGARNDRPGLLGLGFQARNQNNQVLIKIFNIFRDFHYKQNGLFPGEIGPILAKFPQKLRAAL